MLIPNLYGSPDGVGPALVLLAALALDAAFGDPNWLYRRLPHPVAVLGRLIGGIEASLYPSGGPSGGPSGRRPPWSPKPEWGAGPLLPGN